jgi:hypothetical protein
MVPKTYLSLVTNRQDLDNEISIMDVSDSGSALFNTKTFRWGSPITAPTNENVSKEYRSNLIKELLKLLNKVGVSIDNSFMNDIDKTTSLQQLVGMYRAAKDAKKYLVSIVSDEHGKDSDINNIDIIRSMRRQELPIQERWTKRCIKLLIGNSPMYIRQGVCWSEEYNCHVGVAVDYKRPKNGATLS